MKKSLSILLAAIMLLTNIFAVSATALAATPTSGKCGVDAIWTFDKGSGILTITGSGPVSSSNETDEDIFYSTSSVEVDEGYYEELYKPLDYKTYYGLEIKSIVISEGITAICGGVFMGLPNAESISLPSTVRAFWRESFVGTLFKTITVAEDNKSFKSVDNVLYNKTMTCLYLYPTGSDSDAFDIPDTVTHIDKCAFYGAKSLKKVNIPSSVTSIGKSAFCNSGLTEVVLPSSELTIGEYAFYNTHLTGVVIPDTVKGMGEGAFNTESLSSAVVYNTDIGYAKVFNRSTIIYVYPTSKMFSSKSGIYNDDYTFAYIPCRYEGTKATFGKSGKITATTLESGISRELDVPAVTLTYSKKSDGFSYRLISGDKPLIKGLDYDTTPYYGGIGEHSMTFTLKGIYAGKKTINFTIVPIRTKIKTIKSPKKGQIKVTWQKQATDITGYQIQYSTNSQFKNAKKVTVKGIDKTSKTIKKLKSKKRYYFRIRTYKTKNKKNYYSSWGYVDGGYNNSIKAK